MSSIKKRVQVFLNQLNLIMITFTLVFVYFIGVGITALFAKILKRKFLDTKTKSTYWNKIKPSQGGNIGYYHQF